MIDLNNELAKFRFYVFLHIFIYANKMFFVPICSSICYCTHAVSPLFFVSLVFFIEQFRTKFEGGFCKNWNPTAVILSQIPPTPPSPPQFDSCLRPIFFPPSSPFCKSPRKNTSSMPVPHIHASTALCCLFYALELRLVPSHFDLTFWPEKCWLIGGISSPIEILKLTEVQLYAGNGH